MQDLVTSSGKVADRTGMTIPPLSPAFKRAGDPTMANMKDLSQSQCLVCPFWATVEIERAPFLDLH